MFDDLKNTEEKAFKTYTEKKKAFEAYTNALFANNIQNKKLI